MGYRIDDYLNPAEMEALVFAGGHDFGSEGKLRLIFAKKGQSDEDFVVDVAHESVGQDYALGEAYDDKVFAAIAPKGKLLQFLKVFKKEVARASTVAAPKGSTQSDFDAAKDIVDEVALGRCQKLAKQFGFELYQSPKLAKNGNWSYLVDLELRDGTPEYRQGFQVTMSSELGKPGTVHIWSMVTDTQTRKWLQHIKEDVPLKKLAEELKKALDKFEKWVKENQVEDIEMWSMQSQGLKYIWTTEREGRDDPDYIYTTDFGTDNIYATVYSWGEAVFEIDEKTEDFPYNKSSVDTQRKMEAYFEKNLKKKANYKK